jgi:hypothetical protein
MAYRLSFFVATILLWTGCGQRDLSDYYFPLKQLQKEAKVYEYRLSTADTALTVYWYHQTLVQNDSVFLVSTCYDAAFQQLMIAREARVSNGMKLVSMLYFGTNTEGGAIQIPATIEGGAVFPFTVKDDRSVFVNVLKYADPMDAAHITTLTRNRRFLNETTFDYKGQKRAAVLFEMKEEQSETDPKKGGWTHVYRLEEIYAKGIGLVFSKREIEQGQFFTTELVDSYSMADLEAKFKAYLEKTKKPN